MAKILVIDDDGIARDALVVFLTRSGYEVAAAVDGPSGLRLFTDTRPDLVILDRNLPGMTGSVVMKRLRELDKNIPVVILSGYEDPEDMARYLENGATAFLPKSGGLTNTLEKIEGMLKAGGRRPARQKGTAARVLIADDDAAIRDILARCLSAHGYEVFTACDGIKAEEQARELHPDIVLLDINMPGRNGREVLEDLAPEMPAAGFLMISGAEDEETAKSCLKLGAFDYVPKPVNTETLGAIIKTWLFMH